MEYLDGTEKSKLLDGNRFNEQKQLIAWQEEQNRRHTEEVTEFMAMAMSPRRSFIRVLSDVLEQNTGMGLGSIIVSNGARLVANTHMVSRSLENFGKSIFRRR